MNIVKFTTSFALVASMLTGAFFTVIPAQVLAWEYCVGFPYARPSGRGPDWSKTQPLRFEIESENTHFANYFADRTGKGRSSRLIPYERYWLGVGIDNPKVCLQTNNLPENVMGKTKRVRAVMQRAYGNKILKDEIIECPWMGPGNSFARAYINTRTTTIRCH